LSENDDPDWSGDTGFITDKLISEHMPKPDSGADAQIWICGPPPMYEALSGPRGEPEVGGVLAKLGYSADQVNKF